MGFGGGILDRMVRNSVAPATWTAYGKAWQGWCECVGSGPVLTCAETRLQVTLDYLARLRVAGASGTLAQHRMTGLSFHFQLRGWGNVGQHFIIRRVLKGWAKESTVRDCRKPVSFAMLRALVSAVRSVASSPYEASLLATAFGLAFFGAFRISELLAPSRSAPGGLLLEDVVTGPDFLRIRVSRSKTDQLGRGSWVHLRSVPGDLCPVRLVLHFLASRSAGAQFLLHQDGSPLTRFQFTSIFKKCLVVAGENPAEYGTHSFRIGAATEAVRAGLAEGEVMRLGRWQSRCYVGYVRPELLS